MRRLALFGGLMGALLGVGSVEAVTVSQPLSPFSFIPASGSTNRLEITLRETVLGVFNDKETATVTGNLLGSIRLDVVGEQVEVTGLNFSGGGFQLSNMNFSISIPLAGNISANTTNLGGSIATIPRWGVVFNGQFNTLDHGILLNQGTINVGGSLVDPANINLATDPLSLTADANGSVALSTIGQQGNTTDYRARVTIPIDVTQEVTDQPATLKVVGDLVMDGFFSLDFGLPGDYNGDGIVDAADYTVWRDTLGSGSELAADGDNSGQIDAPDYALWRQHYGDAASGGAASNAPVPEPSAMASLLLLTAVLAGAGGFRRGQI